MASTEANADPNTNRGTLHIQQDNAIPACSSAQSFTRANAHTDGSQHTAVSKKKCKQPEIYKHTQDTTKTITQEPTLNSRPLGNLQTWTLNGITP